MIEMIMYVRSRQTWTIKRICIECMAHTYLSLFCLFHCWDNEDRLNDILVRIKSTYNSTVRIGNIYIKMEYSQHVGPSPSGVGPPSSHLWGG